MNMVETSIIIRTFNEEKHLVKLLEAIQQQSYSNYEIILVDSGSTDNTLSIAGRYPVRIISIKPADFSFGYSLNTGCGQAHGEYLVFVSAHTCPLNSNWLSNFDQELAFKVAEIEEKSRVVDLALLEICCILDPEMPYILLPGDQADTPKNLPHL